MVSFLSWSKALPERRATRRVLVGLLSVTAAFAATCALTPSVLADGPPVPGDAPGAHANGDQLRRVELHVRGGEFGAARALADQLEGNDRDAALATITRAQARSGAMIAAAASLREIESPEYRSAATSGYSGGAPSTGGTAGGNAEGRGGGGFADFDSLMQLIQSTVEPDTWEALGGPSGMSPYPQGILVDPAGTVRDVGPLAKSDAVADINRLLQGERGPQSATPTPRAGQWHQPSALRVVSLRRLRDEIARRQLLGMRLSDAMLYLAGISEASHVAFLEDDVLIAGTVGGIASSGGWWIDAKTGLHPLRLDFLVEATRSAFENQPFGCTIDPTPEGLARAQQVGLGVQQGRVPIGLAAEKMAAALGPQRVEVFGTQGNTSLGILLVEVDRHMKQLALGEAAMPEGVKNYLDFVDQMIASGPPSDVLIRLWFTSDPQQVQGDADNRLFRLSGRPLRLSSQNQRAVLQGREVVADDPRTLAFVEEFNQRFEAIRAKYPAYGALESLYRAAAIAALGNRFADGSSTRSLLESLTALEPVPHSNLVNPVSVESIATLHTVRSGRKIHRVLLASGGVLVDLDQSIASHVQPYATVGNVAPHVERKPLRIERWWWDVAAE